MRKPWIALSTLLICLALLSSCASKESQWSQQLEQSQDGVVNDLQRLRQHLEAGHIRNASLLVSYAQYVKKNFPEMAEIVDTLALDATVNGPLYKGLEARLSDVSQEIKSAPGLGQEAVVSAAQELESISIAAAPEVFNGALSDPVNVLADMSGGKLGRVEAMAKEASMKSTGAKDYGVGSQLIGNPNYGHWRQDSNGTSFWEFYGMYAMFSNLFNRPVYYGDWSRRRDYSYYHDRARDYYRSPKQRRAENTTFKRAKQKFSRQGKSFDSPYAKSRAKDSSKFGKVTKTPSKFSSSSRFKSKSYASNKSGSSKRSSGSFFSSYNSRGSGSSSRSFGSRGK